MPFESSRKPNQKKEGKTTVQHVETAVEIQRAVEQRKEEGKEEETEINRPGSSKTRKRKLKSTADKSSKQPKQFRESANFIDENDEKKNGNEVGLLMESDYHDAMNAECYEKYFENVCKLLKPRSVIIIDNASYHSRNDENYPISTWRKTKYQEWLQKNNVTYGTDALSRGGGRSARLVRPFEKNLDHTIIGPTKILQI